MAEEYLRDRRIVELFECLTAALAHEQPQDPLDFLITNLDRARTLGCENVFWDSFLTSSTRVSPIVAEGTARRNSRSSGDVTQRLMSRSRSTLQAIGETEALGEDGDVMNVGRDRSSVAEEAVQAASLVEVKPRKSFELRRSVQMNSSTLETTDAGKIVNDIRCPLTCMPSLEKLILRHNMYRLYLRNGLFVPVL